MIQKNFSTHSVCILSKYVCACALLCCTVFSCQKEKFSTSDSDRLHFSSDTVIFDTIFTERGSITHWFKVYNRNRGTVRIDDIYINQSSDNQFFMNVNGVQGAVKNVEIAAGDSLFIFIQALLNENALDTPRLHKDSIIFRYNNRTDNIILAAWGQDAHVLKGQTVNQNTTWSGRKPYVIFDSLLIAENQTLTIEEGVCVYLHHKANVIVKGSLQLKGSLDKPVVFTTDRLEESFQTLPGQWGSIIFDETSKGNVISYARIINGTNAVLLKATQTPIDMRIENSHIMNMSSHAIEARNAHVDCFNTVLANCGGYLAAFYGGRFAFTHTSLNNTPAFNRNTVASVMVSNDDASNVANFEASYFRNSIITGSQRNEIQIKTKNIDDVLPVLFDNSLLRQTFTEKESVYYKDNTFITDTKLPVFSHAIKEPFSLDTLSQAINRGNLEYAQPFEFDILNNSRLVDQKPDLGAYEYFPITNE
ncbi:MAG: hypothetical protein LBM68_02365 [Bacteroidales bacterium]|jgi:hypothetical protein|nr:hypothetical protein [Bacteroidales bacterium]